MSSVQTSPSKWMLIVSGLLGLLEFSVGITMCLSPQSVIDNVDLSAKGVDYLIKMWAIRQIALGFIFGFATFKKSRPMLTLSYIFFLVMFIGDGLIGFSQNNSVLLSSALLMGLLSLLLLYCLNRKK